VKNPQSGNYLSIKILLIEAIIICAIGLIWYSYKLLKYLLKINFSKSIKDNMFCINRYTIMLKKEKIATYFILTPSMLILGAFAFYEMKIDFPLWTILVAGVALGVLLSFWGYKRIYDKNIQSIKQSLAELEELKEE
jgi:uncharacterized protein (DUF983 family)